MIRLRRHIDKDKNHNHRRHKIFNLFIHFYLLGNKIKPSDNSLTGFVQIQPVCSFCNAKNEIATAPNNRKLTQ